MLTYNFLAVEKVPQEAKTARRKEWEKGIKNKTRQLKTGLRPN